jgi:hypothetical protein
MKSEEMKMLKQSELGRCIYRNRLVARGGRRERVVVI